MRRSERHMFGKNGRHPAPRLISRRQALLISLTGLAAAWSVRAGWADATLPATQVPTAAKPRSVTLFTAAGAGDQDGRDWQNALPAGALSKALGTARPGSGFLIGFAPDDGPIPMDAGQIAIKASGDATHPIFLQAGLVADDDGVAAAGDGAVFFKSARPWSLEDFNKRGSAYFAIRDGASHLRLSGFRIDGTPADGFFKFRGKEATTFEDIVISDIDARNVGRIIETERGAMLRNLIVSDCRAKGIVRGFARFRSLTDATFRNLDLDADHMDAGRKNVTQLIAVTAGKNLLFENIDMRNALNEPPPPKKGKEPGYVQGDGIVCERNTSNVTVRKCHARNMGDGGFDLKSTNVTIEGCTTDSCKFGARIWAQGDNVIRRCSFRNPVSRNETQGACIQAGGTLEIVDTELHAGSGTVAISLSQKKDKNPPKVVMRGGSITLEGSAAVARANANGVLDLENVLVNGVPTTRRFVFEKKKEE